MIRAFLAAAFALALCAVPAAAQTLHPPSVIWGGGPQRTPTPVQIVGYDASGNACILGSSASCQPTAPLTSANITTATTTTVKTGAGVWHGLCINTYVASATVTVYDNTAGSGTKLATITLPSVITGAIPTCLIYDDSFANGLTIVTSGATDLTASVH